MNLLFFPVLKRFCDCLILRALIANTADSLVQCADFRNCLPTQDAPSGPLAVMQGRNFKYGSDLSATPPTPVLWM